MPPKENQAPVLFIDGVNYGPILNIGNLDGVKSDDVIFRANNFPPFTFRVRLKKMSRKRARKLLMSRGMSRNDAVSIVRAWGGHYAGNYFRAILSGCV